MTEKKFNIIDITAQAQSGRYVRRLKDLNGKVKIRTWAAEEFSGGWTEASISQLREYLSAFKGQRPPLMEHICDVEMLRAFLFQPVPTGIPGRSRNKWQLEQLRKPDAGIALVANTTVVCVGGSSRVADDSCLEARGLKGSAELPRYSRVSAHGLSYGTVLVKQISKEFVDGTYIGPRAIKTVVACNNCLELFVGEIDDKGRRALVNVPDSWTTSQSGDVEKMLARESRANSTTRSLPKPKEVAVPKIVANTHENTEQLREAYSEMKVPMLRQLLKDRQLPVSGNKSVLVDALVRYGH